MEEVATFEERVALMTDVLEKEYLTDGIFLFFFPAHISESKSRFFKRNLLYLLHHQERL